MTAIFKNPVRLEKEVAHDVIKHYIAEKYPDSNEISVSFSVIAFDSSACDT